MNVARMFELSTHGDALVYGSPATGATRITHAQLQSDVLKLCHSLQRLGVGPGDRVLVLCTSSVAAVEIILATLRLGAAAMPLNPLLGPLALAAIAERTRPSACFFADLASAETVEALRPFCSVFISAQPFGPRCAHGGHTLASLLDAPAAPFDAAEVAPRQPALLVHTSGSQGLPQTIMMSHERLGEYLEHNAFLFSQFLDLDATHAPEPGVPMVSVLPFSHLGGLGTCLVLLRRAGTLYLPGAFVPRTFLEAIEQSRCRCISLVPSMYRSLLRCDALARTDVSSLRFCITVGEPCPPELAAEITRAFDATVASAYGLTECLTGIGHLRADLLSGSSKVGSCGRLCFGEYRLVSPSGVDSETHGELWVRNSTVARCYLDDALNEARFEGEWFKTRDLFHRDADGFFFHRGRADEMFICNGKNIYPAEVESVLTRHPLVDAACAAGVHSAKKGIVPAALVVVTAETTAEALIDFAARHGPAYAVPQLVKFVPSLPRVGPGKIDRLAAAKILQRSLDARPA